MGKLIIMTKGLPASGKSTWARAWVTEHAGWVRINKDDLRAMFHNGEYSKGKEKQVLRMRDLAIHDALEHGQHVIVDDTNFHPKHEKRIREIAKEHGANVEIKMFDIELEEAIQRDANRANSVGAGVIRRMWREYIQPIPSRVPHDSNLENAIIVDMDGTLATMYDPETGERHRSPFEERMCHLDWPKPETIQVVNRLSQDHVVIICSGRKGGNRGRIPTVRWLRDHGVTWNYLFMREERDGRKDSIIKREIYEQEIKGRFNVTLVIDDRQQVVDMWRNLGLICWQVAEGNF